MSRDDQQPSDSDPEKATAQELTTPSAPSRQGRFLWGMGIGVVLGALVTASIGIAVDVRGDRALENSEQQIAQLEADNSDLTDRVDEVVRAAEDNSEEPEPEGDASETTDDETKKPVDESGIPMFRAGNGPVRVQSGHCVDPDSDAVDWGVKEESKDGLLCFSSTGDNDRFVMNATHIRSVSRVRKTGQYEDCVSGGELSSFLQITIDRYSSNQYAFCFTTHAGRTGHVAVVTPKLDTDNFDAKNPAYVDVLLKVWDDA